MKTTTHSIEFDELMELVKFQDNTMKPYVLTLYGKTYRFEDTSEIVPFVEKKLGFKVNI